MIEAVPLPEPDYGRCRAAVLGQPGSPPQCTRLPRFTRQAEDGQLYGVCAQHKRARWFLPWSHKMLIDQLDAVRAYQRVIEELRSGKAR